MSDGKPRSTREVTERLGVTARAAESACCRYWKAGLLLRSEKPLHEANRVFAGRAGTSYNTRSFYLSVLGMEVKRQSRKRLGSFPIRTHQER